MKNIKNPDSALKSAKHSMILAPRPSYSFKGLNHAQSFRQISSICPFSFIIKIIPNVDWTPEHVVPLFVKPILKKNTDLSACYAIHIWWKQKG